MRADVSADHRRVCVRTALAAAALFTWVLPASAQTTVKLSAPSTQVVYATLRGGTYANTNISTLLETRAASDMTYERHALLKFDTQTTIPVGSSVTSAILTVVVKSASSATTRRIAAYQMTQSWTETETTWNVRRSGESWTSAGGDFGTQIALQSVSNVAGTRVSFDVTPLVRSAVSGALGSSRYTRIGLIDLDAATSASYRAYYTPNDATIANRPTLVVTYGTTSPAPATTSSSTGTLTVLQYNIHHGGIGTDGVYDPNRVANWIVKMNPDIVSLVELESQDSYDSGNGVAQYQAMLQQKTGVAWYTLDIQDYGQWTSPGIRNAILSKIPFSASYRHVYSTGRDRTVGGITVSVNGRIVNVLSTHLDPYDEGNRITQVNELIPYAAGFAEDRIVLGDFNALPYSSEVGTFVSAYFDGWAEAVKLGVQQSAPDNPNGYTRNGRIDYVFYSRGEQHLTLKSVQVVDTRDANGIMPSDHRPVLATFTVH
jgi:endonuclease/exonuclease/phosphatase family metal-dependent hydrolase